MKEFDLLLSILRADADGIANNPETMNYRDIFLSWDMILRIEASFPYILAEKEYIPWDEWNALLKCRNTFARLDGANELMIHSENELFPLLTLVKSIVTLGDLLEQRCALEPNKPPLFEQLHERFKQVIPQLEVCRKLLNEKAESSDLGTPKSGSAKNYLDIAMYLVRLPTSPTATFLRKNFFPERIKLTQLSLDSENHSLLVLFEKIWTSKNRYYKLRAMELDENKLIWNLGEAARALVDKSENPQDIVREFIKLYIKTAQMYYSSNDISKVESSDLFTNCEVLVSVLLSLAEGLPIGELSRIMIEEGFANSIPKPPDYSYENSFFRDTLNCISGVEYLTVTPQKNKYSINFGWAEDYGLDLIRLLSKSIALTCYKFCLLTPGIPIEENTFYLEFRGESIIYTLKDPSNRTITGILNVWRLDPAFKLPITLEKLQSYRGKILAITEERKHTREHAIVTIDASFSDLKYHPLIMKVALSQYSPPMVKQYIALVRRFIQINFRAVNEYKVDESSFFDNNALQLLSIMDLMGIDGLTYLKEKIGANALPLERELATFPHVESRLVPYLNQYFLQQRSRPLTKHACSIEQFKNCLMALDTLIVLNIHDVEDFVDFYKGLIRDQTFDDLLSQLASLVVYHLLEELMVDLDQPTIQTIFESFDKRKLVQLAASSNHMEKDKYRQVFLNFMKLDFMKEDVDSFLHDSQQDNPIGRSLARHNLAIQEKLRALKIDPEHALKYKKIYRFIVKTDETDTSIHNFYLTLWSYLQQFTLAYRRVLQDEARNLDGKNEQRLKALSKPLAEIDKLVLESIYQPDTNASIIDALSHSTTMPLFEKLLKNMEALKKSDPNFDRSLFEFAGHMQQQIALIKEIQSQSSRADSSRHKINKKPYEAFRVEQWDKTRPETFFLGDHVGCCLATNGSQFQAMVQRRMDDAMLFHVVVEQTTNTPVALIWLYLLETKDHQIVLMANFFEVHAKYGHDDNFRKSLLHGLLIFTQQYLLDNPKIAGFYMNQLAYGWNKSDLKSYAVVKLDILDKLGGPYIPGQNYDEGAQESHEILDQESKQMTQQLYYLASLHADHFHQFESKILEREASAAIIGVDALIQHAIIQILEKRQVPDDSDSVLHVLIKQHGLELEPFFTKPMQEDRTLKRTVKTIVDRWVAEFSVVTRDGKDREEDKVTHHGGRFFPVISEAVSSERGDKRSDFSPDRSDNNPKKN